MAQESSNKWHGGLPSVLVPYLGSGAASAARLACTPWRRSVDSAITALAPTSELLLPRLGQFSSLLELDLSGLPPRQPLASPRSPAREALSPARETTTPKSAKDRREPEKRSCEWCSLLASADGLLHQCGQLPSVQAVAMPPGCCDACLCGASEVFPNLQHLQLAGGEVTDAGLAGLAAMPLVEMHMSSAGCITDAGMAHLGQHGDTLKTVVIHGANRITDRGLCALASRYGTGPGIGLRVLSLASCTRIRGEGLAAFSALQSVNLSWCRYLNDGALQDMQDLQQLRVLRLAGCHHITDDGMEYLRGLRLYHLDLQECERLSDRSLQAAVSRMTRLHTLHLQVTRCCSSPPCLIEQHCNACMFNARVVSVQGLHRLTDSGIAALVSCRALEKLDIRGCVGIGDDGLAALCPHLPHLRWLDISSCRRITHKGLLPVARHLPELRHLAMAHCSGVGNTGLAVLGAAQPPLSHLNISACSRVTGTGVAALKPLASTLQQLHVSWCDLNDPAAIQLCSFRHLTHLSLEGCCRVSPHVLEAISGNLPGLLVLDTKACSKAVQKLGFEKASAKVSVAASPAEGGADEEQEALDGEEVEHTVEPEPAEEDESHVHTVDEGKGEVHLAENDPVPETTSSIDSVGVEVITSTEEEDNHLPPHSSKDLPDAELCLTPSKKSWFKKLVSKKNLKNGIASMSLSSPHKASNAAVE